jgi:hypothetical protein
VRSTVLRLGGGEDRREAIHSCTGTLLVCASLGRVGDEPPPGPGDGDGNGNGWVTLRITGERGRPVG